MNEVPLEPWDPIDPRSLPSVLETFDRPWWIAGGWAIDLFLGRTTREHADVDIAALWDDRDEIRRALPSWELFIAYEGSLTRWNEPSELSLPRHQLWCRPGPDAPWSFEILFEFTEGDRWRYRKDARITRSLASFGTTGSGLPIVAPEIQLLYKSRGRRPHDEADAAAVVPALDPTSRSWLAGALALTDPGHPWLALLEPSGPARRSPPR